MGISPFESRFSLWHRKAGRLGAVAENGEMYWGNRLEPVLRDEFDRRYALDWTTDDGGGLWRHRERAWQGGSPDGQIWPLILDYDGQPPDALLECKTARNADGWGEEGTDEIPVHYRAQCLWYLDVFGLSVCHVAVLISGSDYREYRIEHDETELVAMRAAARAFLDTLEAGSAPPLDGHDATYQAVRELHPDIEPQSVDLPPAVARDYLDALAVCKDAGEEKQRCAAVVIEAMGTAQHADYLGDRIASRIQPRTEGEPPFLRATNGAADKHRRTAA